MPSLYYSDIPNMERSGAGFFLFPPTPFHLTQKPESLMLMFQQ
jgi:hypothetical protein